jgi:hypothetical protein
VVRVDNNRFRKGAEVIPEIDEGSLRDTDIVMITCRRRQENGGRGTMVTQYRNNSHDQADVCPLRTLADLTTRRIRGNDGTS